MGPDHIIERLKAIRDSRMRVLALVEAFGQGEPEAWAEALAAMVARAQRVDDADTQATLETVRQAAADPSLAYTTRQALYQAAARRGHSTIARLFLLSSPVVVTEQQLAKQLAPERPLKPTGRPLTLGERKALARTHRREDLLMLIRDPHPAVVAILLDNPHVTETEIVRIAAQRPAVPESLSKIAAHARWSVRHAVKRALVFNPATPLADAIRIATTLRANELAELANDPQLPEPLRRHATELQSASQRRPLS
ncbi:MAG: hypothetical protein SFX73_10835 [Kofleriaceae bacterium]|nr:hypothetical protein [Kofleriaceae bacterium]